MPQTDPFPYIDASRQECISDEQARFFLENGLLVIRNVLRGQELRDLQEQLGELVAQARSERVNHPDFAYAEHPETKQTVPYRIEYVVDKTPAGKVLMGHPFILRTVEKLQTADFIPTWDAVVFKAPGAGAAVPWHRDAGTQCTDSLPIFNVDFYLDEADLTNCVWGILGSNKWSDAQATARINALNQGGFNKPDDAFPIPMQPGDVLLHNILVLHGSPPTRSNLRRVVYYEFRPIRTELALGPHVPTYIPIKQRLLLHCLKHRAASPVSRGEKPFTYKPSQAYSQPAVTDGEELSTYRYPHDKFWRRAGENTFADPWEDADSDEVRKRVEANDRVK